MSARYAVLGSPIAHSLSPALHRAAFAAAGRAATYEAIEVGAGELARVRPGLVRGGVRGVNLTSPLKAEGLAAAGEASDAARAAGAANTLALGEDGRISAENTDGAGFVAFLERVEVPARGRAVTFLGGGGAAAGLVPALRAAGAGPITVLARSPLRARRFAALDAPGVSIVPAGDAAARAAVAGADLLVQATPLGRSPADPLPCPAAWPRAEAVAVDLLYHPAVTPWLSALRARGVRAANGLGLLVEQALLAQRFWFGETPPRHALEQAVAWTDPFAAGSDASPAG